MSPLCPATPGFKCACQASASQPGTERGALRRQGTYSYLGLSCSREKSQRHTKVNEPFRPKVIHPRHLPSSLMALPTSTLLLGQACNGGVRPIRLCPILCPPAACTGLVIGTTVRLKFRKAVLTHSRSA